MKISQSLLLSIISDIGLQKGEVIGINVQATAELVNIAKGFEKFCAVQSMYALHNQLAGLKLSTVPTLPNNFHHAFFVGTKYRAFNLDVFQRVLNSLHTGGVFLTVFENDLGASRFEKEFSKLYSGPLFSIQKSKCRVFGTTSFAPEYFKNDQIPFVEDETSFVFNRGELDRGSQILEEVVRGTLSGSVYEPCSGGGALSSILLANNPLITDLMGIEADWTSVELAKKTCIDSRAHFTWGDATKPSSKKFQTIILNPPFHGDNKTDQMLGLKCIEAAAASLDLPGTLYVVQNEFLPYRKNLLFADKISILTRENGFIVWQYKH